MGIKVLELFSGIGGMRCGIVKALASESDAEISFKAVDLNLLCNEIYSNSFSETAESLDISSISKEWLQNVNADIWTMSPPCQPYTRQGKMKGSLDDRAKPLHHLIEVMRSMKDANIPRLIIIENVKNFEISDSFDQLKHLLEYLQYNLVGYFLNPLYMGFPNSRLRFFLVASLGAQKVPFEILTNDPHMKEYELIDTDARRRTISEFLCQDHSREIVSNLMIPDSVLSKKAAMCFDVVSPGSRQCLCFTRAYTKYINGTGSVLLTRPEMAEAFDDMERPLFGVETMTELKDALRFFCPVEAARLNGFSANDEKYDTSLKLPNGCERNAQYYRAVGNAVNPEIIAFLVKRHWP